MFAIKHPFLRHLDRDPPEEDPRSRERATSGGGSLRSLAVCGATREESFARILSELKADEATREAARLYLSLRAGGDPPRGEAKVAARALVLWELRYSPEQRIPARRVREGVMALAQDGRALLLVLVDHLLALCGRWEDPPPARAQFALHVLAPLAERIGLEPLQRELEDLAFRCLDRPAHERVAQQVRLLRGESDALLRGLLRELEEVARKEAIQATTQGRIKHLWSIHRKQQGKGEASLHDLLGLRLITATEGECYQLLGALHGRFPPVEGRFKDYIARPKENGYRSLHTTLRMDDGRAVVEVQLRTAAMHAQAERGDAAHWRYKLPGEGDPSQAAWVYALTPLGDVLRLPRGSTALDFAYAVHTDLGRRFSGALVDGRPAPGDAPLKTGQVVRILTSGHAHPTERQAARVRTHHARNRIRAALAGR